MSTTIAIAKQPAPTLLPALEPLLEYRKHYTNVVAYLENVIEEKFTEIEEMESNAEEFLGRAQGILEGLAGEVLRLQKLREVEEVEQVVEVSEMNQEPRSKLRSRSRLSLGHRPIAKVQTARKKLPKSKAPLRTEIHLQPPTQESLKPLIKHQNKTRTLKQTLTIESQLKRNSKINQTHLYFHALKDEHYKDFRAARRNSNYFFCEICQRIMKGSKNNCLLRMHYEIEHQGVDMVLPEEKLPTYVFYNQMKQKIQAGELTLYKCNCMPHELPTNFSYIAHLISSHSSIAPPYSSHILSTQKQKGHELIQNSERSQILILQELMMGQFYYCGLCQLNFHSCPILYFVHIRDFHAGVASQECSHFLVQPEEEEKEESQSEEKDQRQDKRQKRKPEAKTRQILSQPDLSEEEQSFLKIIKSFKGVYSCTKCQKIFSSYNTMRAHFESTPQIKRDHFNTKQAFFRIAIHPRGRRLSETRNYYMPMHYDQLDLEAREMKFWVPVSGKGSTVEKREMMYWEIVEWIRDRKTKVYYRRASNNTTQLFKYSISWYL